MFLFTLAAGLGQQAEGSRDDMEVSAVGDPFTPALCCCSAGLLSRQSGQTTTHTHTHTLTSSIHLTETHFPKQDTHTHTHTQSRSEPAVELADSVEVSVCTVWTLA